MARSQISSKGNRVLLSLTFTEAAALEALLCRVDEGTNAGIYEATLEVWDELRDQRDVLSAAGLLPEYFETFRAREEPLEDPTLTDDELDEADDLGGEG